MTFVNITHAVMTTSKDKGWLDLAEEQNKDPRCAFGAPLEDLQPTKQQSIRRNPCSFKVKPKAGGAAVNETKRYIIRKLLFFLF